MRSRLRKAFVAAKLVRFRQPKARARQSVATAACASVPNQTQIVRSTSETEKSR